MKGRRPVNEGFLSLETIRDGLCMCVIQRVNGQDKRCAFERGMVVGARRIGLSVSRTATLMGFSLNSFPMCIKNGLPPKGNPAILTQMWEALAST